MVPRRLLSLRIQGVSSGHLSRPPIRGGAESTGIGGRAIFSTQARDILVLPATVMLATVAIAVANLLTNSTYGILDPRTKSNCGSRALVAR
jgi:hypothetical protein